MDSKALHAAIEKKFHVKKNGNPPWCISQQYTRYHLAELLGEIGFNRGAEIGVRRGKYSAYLCKCNPNLTISCVDPWEAYSNRYTTEKQEELYQTAVANLAPYNAKIVRKRSMDALSDFDDRSLDFVFIDGNHTFDFVVMDIIEWSKKVKNGGIVIIHDYYPLGGDGVRRAVDAYTHCHKIDPWYVTKEKEPTAFWVKP